ncbi:MAG TPA: hypothetical protein VGP24_03560 [Glaciihabitans sp.]|jgi:hypothetical protein|nr:hypothetical protein [Glaciihabitans sp.]
MKKLSKIALLVTSMAALYTGSAFAAPFTAGDLLVSFRATGGQGGDQTYTLNLGNAALSYRDATSNFTVSNIGLDLTSTFGANWATRSDIFWGISGVQNNASPVPVAPPAVNGDPTRTLYVSQDQTTLNTQSDTPTVASSTIQGSAATNMVSFQNAFAAATASLNNANGAVIPTSASNDYAQFQTGSSSFGSTFGYNGIEGSAALGVVSTALDLYRILNSTRTGTYEGTFTIDALGNVAFRTTAAPEAPAVPEPVSTGILTSCAFLGLVSLGRRKKNLIAA